MSAQRIAVTGAGVLCPVAGDSAAFAQALARGERGTRIEASLAERLTLHQARRLDRLAQILLVAGIEAASAARLADVAPERVGLVAGTGLGCLEKTTAQLRGIAAEGLAHLDALGFPESMDNSPAAHAAIALRCLGPSFTVRAREISGESAILLACALLAAERADAVIVLAGDAPGEALAHSLSGPLPGAPAGEAAAALVLERANSARGRDAAVLAEIAASSYSAGPALSPRHFPDAERIAGAEAKAAQAAGLSPSGMRRIEPDLLVERIGWCPADGVLRAIAGIVELQAGAPAVLVSGAARGGAVAALVLTQALPS